MLTTCERSILWQHNRIVWCLRERATWQRPFGEHGLSMMSRATAKSPSGPSAFQQSRDHILFVLTLSVHGRELRLYKLVKPSL